MRKVKMCHESQQGSAVMDDVRALLWAHNPNPLHALSRLVQPAHAHQTADTHILEEAYV